MTITLGYWLIPSIVTFLSYMLAYWYTSRGTYNSIAIVIFVVM